MKWHIRLTRDIAALIPQAHPNIPPVQYISSGILMGLAEYLNMPVFIDLTKLIAPTGIFVGKIGTGKSTSAKALLYRQRFVFGTPTIVFDAHGEYSPEIRRMGGSVIDIKENTVNPCKKDNTLTISEKAMQLTDMLNTIYEFSDIQRAVLIKYIKKGYEKFGEELSFKKITEMISYDLDKRLPDSKTLGALASRFEILADEIFGDENSISLDELTRGLVCIDVSKIHNDHLRNIVMLSILQYIYNSMLVKQENQRYESDKEIKLLIMIDEAGRIASSEHSVATRLVKESRKFKIGLFFGIQDIPDIDSKILSNYGFVFVHQLTNQEYITKIQNDCGFSSEQSSRIRMLPVGTVFLKLNFKDSSYHSPFIVKVLKEDIQGDYPKLASKSPQIGKKAKISEIREVHKVDTTLPEKEKLEELELKLIYSIHENPEYYVTQHYDNINVNAPKGDRIQKALQKKGLVSNYFKTGKKRGKILTLTDNAKRQLNLTETKRFGNKETTYNIKQIQDKLESLGYSTIREYSLGAGKQTDLVVNGINAIEFDSETVREANITKNIQHGFKRIIQICKSKSQLKKFREKIDKLELGKDRDKVILIDYNSFLKDKTISDLILKQEDL